MFDDRADAGERLADLLAEHDIEADIVLAVPVGPPDALTELEYDADEVIAVESPPHFGAVGAFYRDFEQVSDQEAREYLDWPAPAD